jgi:3-deoxy-D-manno-octulosonic-acid transferase
VVLINGRLSERSFRSYRRFRFWLKPLWDCFDALVVRQEQDAQRFGTLGVPAAKLHVVGNLKYDVASEGRDLSGGREPSDGPTVVMGSTREGEEGPLIGAVRLLRKRWPDLRVIWAPRHLERVPEIERLLAAEGIPYARKSSAEGKGVGMAKGDVLWDSLGDLIDAYRGADVAVIGGSFVPRGGQNPIEPAALRVPVVFGPSMDNFHGIADLLVSRGGARQVSIGELSRCLGELLEDPSTRRAMGERARLTVEAEQGATERTLDLLGKVVRD